MRLAVETHRRQRGCHEEDQTRCGFHSLDRVKSEPVSVRTVNMCLSHVFLNNNPIVMLSVYI